MAFQMKVESLSGGGKILPAGIYEVRVAGFKPKWNKNKDGVNFNAQMEVINNPDYDGQKLFETLSSKAGFMQAEFSHAFGMAMEDLGNGQYVIPGVWDADPAAFKEDDPSTWKYDGPLMGRTGKIEVAPRTYEGKEQNGIRQYFCALPPAECAAQGVRHNTDLLKGR